MVRTNPTLIHALIVLVVSIGLGAIMHFSNPNGIWLYTPPADGSGSASNAFGVGVSMGSAASVAFYLIVLVAVCGYGLVKRITTKKLVIPILVAITMGIILFFIGSQIADLASHYYSQLQFLHWTFGYGQTRT